MIKVETIKELKNTVDNKEEEDLEVVDKEEVVLVVRILDAMGNLVLGAIREDLGVEDNTVVTVEIDIPDLV